MGNLCGKESGPDPFSQPGRTLASVPASTNTKISSVPKKISGQTGTLNPSATPSNAQSSSGQEDAKRKAAEAAAARADAANKPKGKLASQLKEQQKQTRINTLEGASRDERRTRDADAGAQARAYN